MQRRGRPAACAAWVGGGGVARPACEPLRSGWSGGGRAPPFRRATLLPPLSGVLSRPAALPPCERGAGVWVVVTLEGVLELKEKFQCRELGCPEIQVFGFQLDGRVSYIMGAPKSCGQLRGQDLKPSLPLSASRLLGGGQIKSRRRQLSSAATASGQRRVQSSRPKHRNKKKWPRQSSDRRLVTTDILTPSKETRPNHDPDPTQKQHANLASVSPGPKRQCKSGPTRSDRPFPLSGSCHVTTTEANPHTTQSQTNKNKK